MTLPRILLFLTIILGLIPMLTMYAAVYAAEPTVKDTNLKVETFVQGLSSPTSMAFLDDNHILVLQKITGGYSLFQMEHYKKILFSRYRLIAHQREVYLELQF
jgi:glucose/arabinose dehydrogenase